MTTTLRPGDYAWLQEKDRVKVVIIKMHRGMARVALWDSKKMRDAKVSELSPFTEETKLTFTDRSPKPDWWKGVE